MNYFGSYRKLRDNSIAAMISMIEIYNKPSFDYREECVVLLAMNSWELLFKAILSKHRISIYRPKEKDKPFQTLNWFQAYDRVKSLIPKKFSEDAVYHNLTAINTYRNNVVHFYNSPDFKVIIYSLLQSCILNYRDYLSHFFSVDLAACISWVLLPIGIKPPYNPIEYISKTKEKRDPAVKQFLEEMQISVNKLNATNTDITKFFSVVKIKLESASKSQSPDIIAGVTSDQTKGPLILPRNIDPNKSHPLRQKGILESVQNLHGIKLNQHVFQAICWRYEIKKDPRYCWIEENGTVTKYSNEVIGMLRQLTKDSIEKAIQGYKQRSKS
ncbi:MAG TPA: hypothetical protein DHW79_00870 [Candidatus Cloacimonas sp.]|jgi:hypothetical protein|nr:hypothetical protein [Candidatus Cloacimonas sp.]